MHCNPVQGQYRASTGPEQVFPCEVFHTGKNLFSLQGTPVLIAGTPIFITGISLWRKLHRETPVFITGNGFAVYSITILANKIHTYEHTFPLCVGPRSKFAFKSRLQKRFHKQKYLGSFHWIQNMKEAEKNQSHRLKTKCIT